MVFCPITPTFGKISMDQDLTIMARSRAYRKRGEIDIDRGKFLRYCTTVVGQSAHRARRAGVPHSIVPHDIDKLLVDQGYRCAVSGILLEASGKQFGGPFGPSLDRVVPALGYVNGNLRVVCQIANVAMSTWGLDPLQRLVDAMATMDR